MRLLMLVCAGGALGAGTRHLIGLWFAAKGLTAFPWATFAINVSGSMLMGVTIGLLTARGAASPELRALLATGILGGYTTFSAFSLDAWQLIERDQVWAAGCYILGSVALSIAALIAGLATVKLVMS
jgi:fluoride exporter